MDSRQSVNSGAGLESLAMTKSLAVVAVDTNDTLAGPKSPDNGLSELVGCGINSYNGSTGVNEKSDDDDDESNGKEEVYVRDGLEYTLSEIEEMEDEEYEAALGTERRAESFGIHPKVPSLKSLVIDVC